MRNQKFSTKTVSRVLILAMLGGIGGVLIAPEGEMIQFTLIGAIMLTYATIMFLRTPHVSYISSFAGWFVGGAAVGFLIGILTVGNLLDSVNLMTRMAMIGILFAILDNFTRAW